MPFIGCFVLWLHGVLIFVCFRLSLCVLREDYEQEPAVDVQGQDFDGSEQQWEGKWSLMHIAPF